MVRSVHLTVPGSKSHQTINLLLDLEHVQGLSRINLDFHQYTSGFEQWSVKHEAQNQSTGNILVIFKCVDKHLSNVLQQLDNLGLGSSFGTIDIYALQSTVPSLTRKRSPRKRRRYNYADRQTVREIEEIVDSGSHLTFDFIALTVVASIIAAVGLLSDSAVTVVASMLVSPLMGPILCISYGCSVKRVDMIYLGLRNELWGMLLCSLVGTSVGLLTAVLFFEPLGVPKLYQFTQHDTYYSDEIESRGLPWALFTGVFVAAPTGMGVALGVTNTSVNALVGVAISASLLPPLVNSGICFMMGLVYRISKEDVMGKDYHYLRLSGVSFSLYLVNFCCICFFAFITFRLKGVTAATREFGKRCQRDETESRIECSEHETSISV